MAGGLLDSLIDALADLLKTFGLSDADAERYATWIVWGGIAVIVFIIALKIYKFIRG